MLYVCVRACARVWVMVVVGVASACRWSRAPVNGAVEGESGYVDGKSKSANLVMKADAII